LSDSVILSWAENAKLSLDLSKKKDTTSDDSMGSQSDLDEGLEAVGVENRSKFLEKIGKFLEYLKQ